MLGIEPPAEREPAEVGAGQKTWRACRRAASRVERRKRTCAPTDVLELVQRALEATAPTCSLKPRPRRASRRRPARERAPRPHAGSCSWRRRRRRPSGRSAPHEPGRARMSKRRTAGRPSAPCARAAPGPSAVVTSTPCPRSRRNAAAPGRGSQDRRVGRQIPLTTSTTAPSRARTASGRRRRRTAGARARLHAAAKTTVEARPRPPPVGTSLRGRRRGKVATSVSRPWVTMRSAAGRSSPAATSSTRSRTGSPRRDDPRRVDGSRVLVAEHDLDEPGHGDEEGRDGDHHHGGGPDRVLPDTVEDSDAVPLPVARLLGEEDEPGGELAAARPVWASARSGRGRPVEARTTPRITGTSVVRSEMARRDGRLEVRRADPGDVLAERPRQGMKRRRAESPTKEWRLSRRPGRRPSRKCLGDAVLRADRDRGEWRPRRARLVRAPVVAAVQEQHGRADVLGKT